MAGNAGKNLHLCFAKLKSPGSSEPAVLRGDHAGQSFVTKNFNSLYDFTFDCTAHSKTYTHSVASDDRLSTSSGSDSDEFGCAASTPDLATVFASQRFFFSSPGRSNSIVDSSSQSPSSTSSPPEPNSSIIGGSIVIPTYSPDPYLDFRRSMQEMVEAHHQTDVIANWDYLHELLGSYLSLNPKSTHKFIVGAFADLLVSLVSSTKEGSKWPENDGRQ